MDIGIIGAGNIGATLTRRLTALGHDVAVANSRGPDTLEELAREAGARAVTASEAAQGRDLVVVTVPESRVPDLPAGLFAGAEDDLVVVDTGNYYPRHRDGAIAAIEEGATESGWVADQIGHPVIKAFNNIYADHLMNRGQEPGTPGRIALPVAGDDERAKRIVMDLVDQLGFDPIDAGTLAESWRQQPGSPVYTASLDAEGVRAALAAATPERPEDFRATPDSPGTYAEPA